MSKADTAGWPGTCSSRSNPLGISELLDSKQNLINAAIRPFHNDAEMEMAASHLLGEMVPDAPAGAEDAIARWQDVDARARKPLWGLVLAGLMIAVTAWVVFKDFHEVVRYVKWSRSLGGNFFVEMPEVDSSVMDRLRPNEKLLLQGSILGVDPLVPKEAMWRSDPENPAFYTEYASAHVSMHDKLPADFLETVQRIDPQNSWFTYLAASLEAKESVKRNKRKSSRVAGKIVFSEPVSWEILDQAKMDRVMDLVHKAEAQEKFDNYSREMFRKRIKLLPDTSLIERMDLQMCVYMRGSVNNLRLRFIVDVIAAKASSAADAGDKQGFLDAKKFGEHYMATMMQSATTSLVDELILNMAVGVLTESLASGSEKLGLVEEAQRWRSIYDRIDSRNQSKGSRKFIVDGRSADPAMISGGLFGGTLAMVAKQPEYQPRLTDADLMPGRLLDHEILSRFLSYLSWVLVLFILLSVTLYRYRVSCLARKLVSRTEKLLLPRDWLWLIGAGILLPLIIVMAVNRLTPLGGRQFGMMGTTMMLPLAHFLGGDRALANGSGAGGTLAARKAG